VRGVNPASERDTGQLQQFVVTADISDTTGAITIPISPPIITSGQLITVTGSPADNAVITVLGATSPTAGTLATTTTSQGMIFAPGFAAFVMADLFAPDAGAKTAMVRSKKYNISIRFVEQFDIRTDKMASRLDMLVGFAVVQPRLGCRVYGA
jgi:hypothetical protein